MPSRSPRSERSSLGLCRASLSPARCRRRRRSELERCRCLRPVHGPLLEAAGGALRRFRRTPARRPGPRRRMRPRCADRGARTEGRAGTGHGGRPVRGIRRGPTRPPSRSPGHPRAEDLPFEGGCFDATLAQLVVNVMDDPVAGLREMARVTRDGGVVAACVWDFTDGGPIGPFWDAAQAVDPELETGSVCPGSRAGHLADLFRAAGIGDIVDSAVTVDVEHATFEDWWEPFTLGVAPSGAHVAGLEPDRRTALRELCRE